MSKMIKNLNDLSKEELIEILNRKMHRDSVSLRTMTPLIQSLVSTLDNLAELYDLPLNVKWVAKEYNIDETLEIPNK